LHYKVHPASSSRIVVHPASRQPYRCPANGRPAPSAPPQKSKTLRAEGLRNSFRRQSYIFLVVSFIPVSFFIMLLSLEFLMESFILELSEEGAAEESTPLLLQDVIAKAITMTASNFFIGKYLSFNWRQS
jgi:hypothetical protein